MIITIYQGLPIYDLPLLNTHQTVAIMSLFLQRVFSDLLIRCWFKVTASNLHELNQCTILRLQLVNRRVIRETQLPCVLAARSQASLAAFQSCSFPVCNLKRATLIKELRYLESDWLGQAALTPPEKLRDFPRACCLSHTGTYVWD